MKRFCFKNWLFLLFVLNFMITSCGSSKKITSSSEKRIGAPGAIELKNPILENVELSMSSVLALSHAGNVTMNLYEKYIEVSFHSGGAYLNPKTKNKSYNVQSIDVGLGKYTDRVHGKWKVYNKSPKMLLNYKIKSATDTLKLSNTKFYLYYGNPTELKDAWVIISYNNGSGGMVYNHSQKLGHYFKEYVEAYVTEKMEKDYSGKSSEELIRKQFEIQKKISYSKAEHYLKMVDDGKSHSALVKMNFKERNENWKRNPELSKYYHSWKNSVKEYTTFINRNSPELRRLQISYKEKRISRDRYYKERQKALSDLRNKYPHDYDTLNRKFQFDLKKLWLQTGEFYLTKYKSSEKIFPSEWIEDRYIKSFIESSFYKSLKAELDFIEKEIINRI